MARMDHNPDSRISFGLREDLVDELDHLADEHGHESRSHLLRELCYDYIRQHRDTEDDDEIDGYVPSHDEQRTIYLAALDASSDHLRLHERHLSIMAQTLNTYSAESIESILNSLRREGYVALVGTPVDCSSELPSQWRIKPRAVDPDDWSYRERQRDSRRDITPLLSHGMDTDDFAGECLSHHPTPDGTRCMKCDAELDPADYGLDECDCGAALSDDEDRCPACRMTADEVEA